MEGPRAEAASLAAIRRLIDERYNDNVRARVHRYAGQRAALLRRSGQPVTATDVEELVHDAVAGLWLVFPSGPDDGELGLTAHAA